MTKKEIESTEEGFQIKTPEREKRKNYYSEILLAFIVIAVLIIIIKLVLNISIYLLIFLIIITIIILLFLSRRRRNLGRIKEIDFIYFTTLDLIVLILMIVGFIIVSITLFYRFTDFAFYLKYEGLMWMGILSVFISAGVFVALEELPY